MSLLGLESSNSFGHILCEEGLSPIIVGTRELKHDINGYPRQYFVCITKGHEKSVLRTLFLKEMCLLQIHGMI